MLIIVFLSEIKSYVLQTTLEPTTLLPYLPKCWGYRVKAIHWVQLPSFLIISSELLPQTSKEKINLNPFTFSLPPSSLPFFSLPFNCFPRTRWSVWCFLTQSSQHLVAIPLLLAVHCSYNTKSSTLTTGPAWSAHTLFSSSTTACPFHSALALMSS